MLQEYAIRFEIELYLPHRVQIDVYCIKSSTSRWSITLHTVVTYCKK